MESPVDEDVSNSQHNTVINHGFPLQYIFRRLGIDNKATRK